MNGAVTLNNALVLSYPEGFHVMDEREREKLIIMGNGPWQGLSDPKRHISITVGWKALGSLSSRLLSTGDAVKDMKARIEKPMRAFGYSPGGHLSKDVGGERAEGFCYEYKAQGVGMYAESYVIKRKKVFYYLHFYARTESKSESLDTWNDILSSASWI